MIASLAASLALLAGPTAGLPPATPVGMSAREYSFGVYKTRVPTGRVKLNVHNYGEDAHDLQVRGPHGYRSAVSPEIDPGETISFNVRLRPRPLPVHLPEAGARRRGMKAHITVRKRGPERSRGARPRRPRAAQAPRGFDVRRGRARLPTEGDGAARPARRHPSHRLSPR